MPSFLSAPVLKRAFSLVLLSAASIASAETHTFNLLGNTNNIAIYNGNYVSPPNLPYTSGWLNLSDAATGLNSISGFTFNVGDSINGTVALNQSLVVPGGASWSSFGVNLGWMAEGTSSVDFSPRSITFFDKGVQVSPPSTFSMFIGSGGALSIGGYTTAGPVASFQFDKIAFNTVVSHIFDANGQSIASGATDTSTPKLTYTVTSPVPEPTSAFLLIFGLGILALAKKVAPCSSSKRSGM